MVFTAKNISINLIVGSLIAIVSFLIFLPMVGIFNDDVQALMTAIFDGTTFGGAMNLFGYAMVIFIIFALLAYLSFQPSVQRAIRFKR